MIRPFSQKLIGTLLKKKIKNTKNKMSRNLPNLLGEKQKKLDGFGKRHANFLDMTHLEVEEWKTGLYRFNRKQFFSSHKSFLNR